MWCVCLKTPERRYRKQVNSVSFWCCHWLLSQVLVDASAATVREKNMKIQQLSTNETKDGTKRGGKELSRTYPYGLAWNRSFPNTVWSPGHAKTSNLTV